MIWNHIYVCHPGGVKLWVIEDGFCGHSHEVQKRRTNFVQQRGKKNVPGQNRTAP